MSPHCVHYWYTTGGTQCLARAFRYSGLIEPPVGSVPPVPLPPFCCSSRWARCMMTRPSSVAIVCSVCLARFCRSIDSSTGLASFFGTISPCASVMTLWLVLIGRIIPAPGPGARVVRPTMRGVAGAGLVRSRMYCYRLGRSGRLGLFHLLGDG
uniref:Uncharacterized protein n=1 Tax=Anopheles merus TaxID=30066 RepID=A0A182VCW3_ANOME